MHQHTYVHDAEVVVVGGLELHDGPLVGQDCGKGIDIGEKAEW
jgi:hypothetical protein